MRFRFIFWMFLLGGCQTEPIPVYAPMLADQAMRILADRTHAVHDVSAQGYLRLVQSDGQEVNFEAAMAMEPPDRVRLRAWKFSQAVFDLTLTAQGLWMVVPEQKERRDKLLATGPQTADLLRQWMRLTTGLFDEGKLSDVDGKLEIRQSLKDGMTMVCQIDRRTLTARRYAICDAQGIERFTLKLSRYAEFGGVVWPRHIEAIGPAGSIELELRDVDINGGIAPAAFVPPARAEKLP